MKKLELLKPKKALVVVNEYNNEEFSKKQLFLAEVKESISMRIRREVIPLSFDAKRTMLESERMKAEAFCMLRLREISR